MKTECKFAIFGFLWGIPIPVVTVLVALMATGTPLSLESIVAEFHAHPVQFVFLAHPLLFAMALAFLGRQRDRSAQMLKLLVQRLEHDARSDMMTGLLNHATFWKMLEAERARHIRKKPGAARADSMCVLMVDIDFFKKVNDQWGHLVGDAVLIQTASLILAQVRPYDHVARYGGEEFAVILPDTTAEDARQIAGRIRTTIEAHFFPKEIRITVSIGLAPMMNGESANELMAGVDAALYQAKKSGRNQVVCAS
ncbi:MAG: GGDEF domain-containing protein [Candidatus Hydrogenedentota bacterium]